MAMFTGPLRVINSLLQGMFSFVYVHISKMIIRRSFPSASFVSVLFRRFSAFDGFD